jgi:hypothetical protein
MKPILLGLVKEPEPEVDPDRPISYRLNWILLIVFGVATIGLVAGLNVNPLVFTSWLVIFLFILVGIVRYIGESGGLLGTFQSFSSAGSSAPIAVIMAAIGIAFGSIYMTDTVTSEAVMTRYFMGNIVSTTFISTFIFFGVIVLSVFKLARMTKTMLSDVLKAGIIAVVVGCLVASIASWYWMGIYAHGVQWGNNIGTGHQWAQFWDQPRLAIEGIEQGLPGYTVLGDQCVYPNPSEHVWNIWENPGGVAGSIVIGGIVSAIIPLIKTYAWAALPLNLPGFILGYFFGASIWAPALVALIIKLIALKIGGTKMISEKIMPLGIALVLGQALAYALALMIGYANNIALDLSGINPQY